MEAICSPLGDQALLLQVGDSIDAHVNEELAAFADHLAKTPFSGFIEVVPAYSSLAVYFDLTQTHYAQVESLVQQLWGDLAFSVNAQANRVIEIPVRYDGEDLSSIIQAEIDYWDANDP